MKSSLRKSQESAVSASASGVVAGAVAQSRPDTQDTSFYNNNELPADVHLESGMANMSAQNRQAVIEYIRE